mmetsp:Transcript_18959/g.59560  ORF Transcript_18959/g.59560 Transcript_18959/m.59560 type:complete len:136 (+) Transcript_18959:77-484(+)
MGLREKHFVEDVFENNGESKEEKEEDVNGTNEGKANQRRAKPRYEYFGAEKDALAAIEADPSNPRHHWNLMVIYETREEFELAIKHIELYIEKGDPDGDGDRKKEALLDKQRKKNTKGSRRGLFRVFSSKKSLKA